VSGRPGKADLSEYKYGAISSLGLTADRFAIPRRDKEPDGATSLAGRINPVQREAPKDLKKKQAEDQQEATEKQVSKRRTETAGFGYTDIIEATQDVEGLAYRPRTTETCETYESILLSVHQALGDQAQDIVRTTIMSGLPGKADLPEYDYGSVSSLVVITDRSAILRRKKRAHISRRAH
jgi:pre-mRNA-splicing helicase BRR2